MILSHAENQRKVRRRPEMFSFEHAMGDEGAAVSNCLLCDSYALLTLGLLPDRKLARGIKGRAAHEDLLEEFQEKHALKDLTFFLACPTCNAPKLSLASALHTPTMECFACPGHPTFDISGLALWSSDDDSLASALAAAHREVLNNTAEAVAPATAAAGMGVARRTRGGRGWRIRPS